MAGGLTQTALAGMRWSALAQLLSQIAQYGSFILLVRWLSPGEIGTLASVQLVVGLALLLNELGLGAAIIQRAEITRGHLAACFWASLAVGLTLSALTVLAAGTVASFFRNPEVAPVLMAIAPGFALAAASVLPRALLERALRFKALGAVEAGSAIANGGLTIALALSGFGVWSVVAGTLVGYVVLSGGLWALHRERPPGRFSRLEARELLSFGASVLGSRVVGYGVANVDYMIVGRVMGPASLGVYSLAYKLVTLPVQRISQVALRVAFPAFARVQHDLPMLRRQYMRLVSTLALLVLPLLAGLAVFAPEAIFLVFGPAWEAAVLPTQLLCLVGAFKALVCTVGAVFMSQGRPDLEFKLNVFGAVKLPLFLLVGVNWGLPGVATAYMLSSLTGAPLQQHLANRLIGLRWREYMAGLAGPVGATGALTLILLAWRALAQVLALGPAAALAIAIPLAAACYLGLLSLLGVDWRGLFAQLAGRPSAPPAAERATA